MVCMYRMGIHTYRANIITFSLCMHTANCSMYEFADKIRRFINKLVLLLFHNIKLCLPAAKGNLWPDINHII